MITKTTKPILGATGLVEKTVAEYRVFGILLLKKELYMNPPESGEYVYRI